MFWLCYFILLIAALAGLLLVALTLPGLWFITSAAAAYAAITHERYLGLKSLIAIFTLTVAAEFLESLLGKVSIQRTGASPNALVGAAIGATAGGIFFTFIPIPIVGTLLGVCLGAFLGAAVVELYGGNHPTHSLKVGLGAVRGRVVGLIAKLIIGCVILIVIAWTAWP